MRVPSKITSPLSGSTKPPIMRSVVVLPQPLGPKIVTNSFSRMSRLIWFRITSPSNLTKISFKDTMTFLDVCSIYAPLFFFINSFGGIIGKTTLDYMICYTKSQQ